MAGHSVSFLVLGEGIKFAFVFLVVVLSSVPFVCE